MGYRSDPFPIARGMRQGCPLSPLLFSLAIVPLAQLICADPTSRGLERGGHHQKLCLFADDILLFMTVPLISTPNLLKLLDAFGCISVLRVNPFKSTALNISIPPAGTGPTTECLTIPLVYPVHFIPQCQTDCKPI